MKNLPILITLILILTSCNNRIKKQAESQEFGQQQEISTKLTESDQIGPNTKTQKDLKTELKALEENCLNFYDLQREFINSDYSEKLVDRNKESWIFDLDRKDSLQFEHADFISPKCKIFENSHIVSIAFVDLNDYKTALHLFTFKKPDLIPTSSFIFYQFGADAEDYWNINLKRIESLKYQIIEEAGYDNHSVKENQFFVEFRQTREYVIDSVTGKLTKKILKTEKNVKEIRE